MMRLGLYEIDVIRKAQISRTRKSNIWRPRGEQKA